MALRRLRWRLVDEPQSWGSRRRAERAEWLVEHFPDLGDMTVLDLGGRLATWERSPVRPQRIHVVNLEREPADVPAWAEFEEGDACDLPASVTNRRYDLVFSNSVIEHVGGHDRRLRFAEAVRSLAPAYWVQTPYRYFPLEPHWLVPGMQFLPVSLRSGLALWWPLGHTPARDRQDALSAVLWTELLDRTQMRYYFPDARLLTERVGGLIKSLVAVRRSAGRPPPWPAAPVTP